MGLPAAASVVLIPFPFCDLSDAKLRPALVIASAGRGDWVLCQITSSPYGDPGAIELFATDIHDGALLLSSFVRRGKLFTASQGLFRGRVASLTPEAFGRVVEAVVTLVRSGLS